MTPNLTPNLTTTGRTPTPTKYDYCSTRAIVNKSAGSFKSELFGRESLVNLWCSALFKPGRVRGSVHWPLPHAPQAPIASLILLAACTASRLCEMYFKPCIRSSASTPCMPTSRYGLQAHRQPARLDSKSQAHVLRLAPQRMRSCESERT